MDAFKSIFDMIDIRKVAVRPSKIKVTIRIQILSCYIKYLFNFKHTSKIRFCKVPAPTAIVHILPQTICTAAGGLVGVAAPWLMSCSSRNGFPRPEEAGDRSILNLGGAATRPSMELSPEGIPASSCSNGITRFKITWE